jgi:hypothetical protein
MATNNNLGEIMAIGNSELINFLELTVRMAKHSGYLVFHY